MVAAVLVAGCASGATGLGRQACPYLRPRLVRLDAATLNHSTADIVAVDQDVGLYLRAARLGSRDGPLRRFSTALDRYVADPSAADALSKLSTAETAVKEQCRVRPA